MSRSGSTRIPRLVRSGLRRLVPAPADGTDPAGRSRERLRRAGLTAVSGVGGRALTMALSLMTVPLTLGYLGPERYGMWLTISSMIALLTFADLGIGNGLVNAVSQALARHDAPGARRAISSAAAMLAVVATGLGLLCAALYPAVAWEDIVAVSSREAVAEAGPALAVWAAWFLVGLPFSIVPQVRRGMQEGYVVHLTAAAGNIGSFVALLLVIAAGLGVPWLVSAMAGPPLIASIVNGVVLFRRDAPELRPAAAAVDRATGVGLLRVGFLFFVLQVAMAVAFTSDSIVLAQLIGPEAVAEYGVAQRLFMVPTAITALSLAPLWPAYGEAITRGEVAWARTTLARSLKASFAISGVLCLGLVAFGQPIIETWIGGVVMPPFMLLVAFGAWTVMNACGTAVAMLLNGAGAIRLQAAAAALMAVANLVLSIWLTSQIGVAGVMVATVLSYGALVLLPMAVYVPGVLRRLERRAPASHTDPDWRDLRSEADQAPQEEVLR